MYVQMYMLYVRMCVFVDEERIGHKRRKKIEHFSNFFGNRMAPMPPPSGGGPTGGGDPSKWPLIAFSCDLPYFTIWIHMTV